MSTIATLALGAAYKGKHRVIRGGSWNENARNARSAMRNANDPENRNNNLGFWLARAHAWDAISTPDPSCIQPGAGVSADSVVSAAKHLSPAKSIGCPRVSHAKRAQKRAGEPAQ